MKSKLYSSLSDDSDIKLKEFCTKYFYNVKRKWESGHRMENVFRNKYSEWLEFEIFWPCFVSN